MRSLSISFLFLSAAAFAQQPGPANAAPGKPEQQPPVMRSIPDPATPQRVGVGITQRKLSLKEALELALENNLDIEIERTTRDTAEQSVRAARGAFDPVLRWQPLFNLQNTPTGSVLQGASGKLTDRGVANNIDLRKKFQTYGTEASLSFQNARTTTNNPFTSFSPLISSQLALNFTQPLLRGLRLDPQRA
ncbi:MAG TPA: TolC family protein, partial [Bryobacteraceae bacterium]|nr:TolC family protein [Bryobacteraceae bacterium]